MSRVAVGHMSTFYDDNKSLITPSLHALPTKQLACYLSRIALAFFVFTQIITLCSTFPTSIPQIPWQGIDFACKAFSLAFALISMMLRAERLNAARATLLAAVIGTLFLSATRSAAVNLLAGLIIIASAADDDWEELCLIHCRATILAVVVVILASLGGLLSNHDFIPNGRLVFAYGFTHPNGLGGLLFSAAGSMTCARWKGHAPVLPLVFSGCCAAFSYVALSSNASAALCGAVFVINVLGLVIPKVRNATMPRRITCIAILFVPAALLAIMLVSAAHYDAGEKLFAALNSATHARPYYSHEYYKAAGGFTFAGAPMIARGARHAGATFWGLDSGYGHLALVYGLTATGVLSLTYGIASWRASRSGIDMATLTIILLCAFYLVVEPLPLSLHLSFSSLFLINTFADKCIKLPQDSK